MPEANVKVVLIDLDDTLFDHEYSCLCGFKVLQEGFPLLARQSLSALYEDADRVFEIHWEDVLWGRMTLETWQIKSFRLLFTHYGITPDEQICQAAAKSYRTTYQQSRRAVAGAVDLLQALKSVVQVGIVTNHLAAEQADKLNCCQLNPFVDFVICSETAGVPKPDPHIFKLALQQARCNPDEAVMLGDSWSSDIVGASGSGIRAVWYNPNGRACPDPALATQITSFEPVEAVFHILMGNR